MIFKIIYSAKSGYQKKKELVPAVQSNGPHYKSIPPRVYLIFFPEGWQYLGGRSLIPVKTCSVIDPQSSEMLGNRLTLNWQFKIIHI